MSLRKQPKSLVFKSLRPKMSLRKQPKSLVFERGLINQTMIALKSKKITRASRHNHLISQHKTMTITCRKMSLRKQPKSLAFKSLRPKMSLRKQPKSLVFKRRLIKQAESSESKANSPSSKVRLLKEEDDEKMKEYPYSTSEGDAFVI